MSHVTPALPVARTALFTPATRPDRLLKAQSSGADAVIADLEDAVPAADKQTARQELTALLRGTSQAGQLQDPVAVRINAADTPEGRPDLQALAELEDRALLDSVLAPKLESTEQVELIAQAVPGVPVVGMIESAIGLLRVEQLAGHPAVARLSVGALDLGNSLGCAQDSRTMGAALARVVAVSAAFGLVGPLDSPTPEFRDPGPAERAARTAKADGFGGKLCIHPAQIPAVAAGLAPTPEEADWARTVVDAADGATAVDGAMVDAPVIARARAVLAAAQD